MIPSQLDHRLKLVIGAFLGLLIAALGGLCIGSGDYRLLVVGVLAIGLFIIWFGTGDMFWLLTVASSFLAGTFPILGGSFNTFQILIAIGIAKYVVEEVIFRRQRITRINRYDLILLLGFMGILTLHALRDRFGMRFLGSQVWGGRNYVNVYVGLAAFFIIQSVRISPKAWARLPYLILAVTLFDLAIALITTIYPASIYKIFPFYSAVSTAGITEIVTGEAVETVRVGGFGNFGFALITLVLASTSLRKLLYPSNLGRMFAIAIGWIGVLVSSFRSAIFNTVIVFALAGIRDLRWAAIALLPVLAAFLFGLSILNSDFVHLPKQVQRTLSFLPGQWDTEMKLDASASNEFRERVWTLWRSEYFPVHPWLGRGFGFRSEEASSPAAVNSPEEDKMMVEVGNIHSGFYATVDALGMVGTVFFVLWNLRLLIRILTTRISKRSPAEVSLRFIGLTLGVYILSFWVGAQNLGSFLPQEFALAGVFLALARSISLEGHVSRSKGRDVEPFPARQLATP